jgi:hypothetical protein
MNADAADAAAARRAVQLIESFLDSDWSWSDEYPDPDDRAQAIAALWMLCDELRRRGAHPPRKPPTDPPADATLLVAALMAELPDDPRLRERLAHLVDQSRATTRALRASAARISEDAAEIVNGVDPDDPRRDDEPLR